MVDVDNLSDAELRTKLIEFGFPVMPITGTTRKVMVKKLKLLMENSNKIKKDDRRSLGQYSSEDDSDIDTTRTVKKDNYNKRATIGGGHIMQPPPSSTSSTNAATTTKFPGRKSTLPPTTNDTKKITTVTTRTEKFVRSARDEYDTGSESDDIDNYQQESSRSFIDNYKTSPSPRLPTSYLSASTAVDNIADRLNKIRSRYSSSYDKPLYTSSPSVGETLHDDENTPFLSNFTKTLSQLKESPKNLSNYEYRSDTIKEHDINGSGANTPGARTYLNSYRQTTAKSRPSLYNNNHNPNNSMVNLNIFKNNFVPFMVLFVAIIFFIIIALVYVGIKSDSPYEISVAVPRCDNNNNTIKKKYVNCIYENDINNARYLFKLIKPQLDHLFINNLCYNNNNNNNVNNRQFKKSYMSEENLIDFVQTKYNRSEEQILNDLKNLEVLLFFNTHWGISVIQFDKNDDGDGEFNDDMIATDMETVNNQRSKKITGLISTNPSIPWQCYLTNLITKIVNFVLTITLGIAILLLINYLYKYYKQYYQHQYDEEITMVESIIDILQTNCNNIVNNDDNNNYLVINHIRDMLIPINQRKHKQKTWARVVKYIDENESRIRTELQVVKGEPTEVWRWLGGPAINASKNKVWQGQAFETQSGSVNSLNCSPTPCLKIRGMIEDGDRNVVAIKKAVLTKCAQQCRILHCEIDSNCVYLKCADRSDALIAYRNLHGWWYAGNLVTVKYLKLERYMQRFPDSPISGPPYLQ